MPRSLLSCYEQIIRHLDLLAEAYGGKRGECHRLAGEMHARLRYGRIQDIFQSGLHEFLTEFIERSIMLGARNQQPLPHLIAALRFMRLAVRHQTSYRYYASRSPMRSRRCV